MTDKISISWTEYHSLIEELSLTIYRSGWSFNAIICLARGGLRVGDILSRIFDCPLAILSTSSYQDHQRGKLTIAHSLTMTMESLPDKILLVDDLVDSGETIVQTIEWLQQHHPITEIKTAVLWYKTKSKHLPDYYVKQVADNLWIEQPFESYEHFAMTKVKQLIHKDWNLGVKILARLPVNRKTNSLLIVYLLHAGTIDREIESLFDISSRLSPPVYGIIRDHLQMINDQPGTLTNVFACLQDQLEPYTDRLDLPEILGTLFSQENDLTKVTDRAKLETLRLNT